jgi:hypothetical protein
VLGSVDSVAVARTLAAAGAKPVSALVCHQNIHANCGLYYPPARYTTYTRKSVEKLELAVIIESG